MKDSQDTFPLYAGTVTISDKVNAEISKVEGLTNGDVLKSVTISYSEPVKAGAAIKIDGVKVGVTEAGVSQEIKGLSLDSSKNHTVEIVNLTDSADNVNALATYSFNATKDTTAPTVKSVTALNDTQFVVEFSEKMNAASVEKGDFAVVKSSTLSPVTVNKVEALADDTTGTKFVVTTNLSSGDYTSVSSIGLNVAFASKAFTDVAGNESAASTATVTLSKDTVAPAFTSAVFEKDKDGAVTKVTLNFDEEVVLGTNMDHSDLEVVAENGVLQSDLFTKTEVNGKKVVLTVKSGVKSGKFSIGLPVGFVVDKAITPNKSVATSTIVDFGKADASTTFDVTKAEIKSTNVITVTYPKAVVGGSFAGSATSLDRYTLNGKALPAGTKITLDSEQKVATITLPVGTIATTDDAAVFQISGVKALTGETNKFFTTTLKVTDNVAPVLTSAQVLADGQTFVLTYDENLGNVGSNLGNEFKITVDGKDVTLKDDEFAKVSTNGKQIIAKVKATVTNNDAKVATAVVSGTNASVATVSNGDKATKDTTYNYTVKNNAGTLEVLDASNVKAGTLDNNGDGTFIVDGVTVTVKGAKDGNTFTVTTTAPVAATTSDVKLDTSKVITIETVSGATDTLNFDVEDVAGNDQKAEVKVTTTR